MTKVKRFIILAMAAITIGILTSLAYYNNVFAESNEDGGYITACFFYGDENNPEDASPINWGFITIGE